MALSIKNRRADELVRELVAITGETMTDAITVALEQRLARERARRLHHPGMAARLGELSNLAAGLVVLDDRNLEDIIGYDESGLPR